MALQMTPVIAIHLAAAVTATVIGPLALWARLGRAQHPRLHRAFGYAWVTLMVVTAVSAIFIRSTTIININGYTPIHLLIPVVFGLLFLAFWFLARGNISGHRRTMLRLYIGGCIVAGSFTLLPNRYLGNLIWKQWLGLHDSASLAQHILAGTPMWVWALLAGLVALGLSQIRTRRTGLARALALPLSLGALSLYGTVSAFGATVPVLACWALAAAPALALVLRRPLPAGARYDTGRREFEQPGSWIPLLLILGIFCTKYAVGILLAMHPEQQTNTSLALPVAALYGFFSGLFAGRSLRLLRLVPSSQRGAATSLSLPTHA